MSNIGALMCLNMMVQNNYRRMHREEEERRKQRRVQATSESAFNKEKRKEK